MSAKRTTWRVEGMHCPHCDRAVTRAIEALPGVSEARADYRRGSLTANWDAEKLKESELARALAEAGYTLIPIGARDGRVWRLIAALCFAAGLFLLFEFTDLRARLSAFPTAREGMGYGALVLLGLMTSLHCVGMCGGINLAQSAQAARAGRGVSRANLQYNLGRVASYTITGALAGALGGVFRLSTTAQAAIQLVAAAFMLLMALRLMDAGGFMPTLPEGLRRVGGSSSLIVGLLNGLMPCGPLQSMQLYALATGSWQRGALSMLCFSIGTVPLMLSFGLLSGRLNARFGRVVRIASGVIVLVMAASMLTNGLALAGFQLGTRDNVQSVSATTDGARQTVYSELEWRGYPDITVKAGTPVVWTIHADAEKITGCNNEMVIPALNLRVPLEPGDNVVEFTTEAPGVIEYTCWMGMLRGTITTEE